MRRIHWIQTGNMFQKYSNYIAPLVAQQVKFTMPYNLGGTSDWKGKHTIVFDIVTDLCPLERLVAKGRPGDF